MQDRAFDIVLRSILQYISLRQKSAIVLAFLGMKANGGTKCEKLQVKRILTQKLKVAKSIDRLHVVDTREEV